MRIEYEEHLISAVLNSFLQTGTELKILSALETLQGPIYINSDDRKKIILI